MNWLVALVVGYLMLGFELSVRPALGIGPTGVAPSFLVPLMVFVALSAPPLHALWYAFLLGLLMDLTADYPTLDAQHSLTIVGPVALGFLAGAYLTLTMRGVMIRRNPLAMVFMAVVAGALANVVIVAMLSIRVFYGDPIAYSPGQELLSGILSSLYTAGSAALLTLVLIPLTPLFGFQDTRSRRFIRRNQ